MADFRVIIPDESYSLFNFQKDHLPGVAAVNTALKEFEPKIVF